VPAKSSKQQHFMQMVMATKHGDMKNPSPGMKKAAKSMTEKQVKDFMVKKKGK
jgi:hypothetical protein